MKELAELYRKNKEGDQEARDELVSHHLPLVRTLAGRYAFKEADYDDIYQEGCLGLLKALEKYDPGRGVQFSTYAVPFILGEMRSYLRQSGYFLKVSRSQGELFSQLLKSQAKMEQELKRRPHLEELAASMGLAKEEIVWLLELQHPPVPLQEEGAVVWEASPCGEKGFSDERLLDHILLKEKINSLPFRERQIIALRYLLEKSQEEVAGILNLSQSYVSRLERKILEKFKRERN